VIEGLLRVTSGVVVFSPDRAEEARAHGLALVAFMAAPRELAAEGAYARVALRADAYASDEETLALAIAFAAHERRDDRARGPLRLTYLGSLGEYRPPRSPPIGGAVNVGSELFAGRMEDCGICLRQGPHSDQNTVARRHARFERIPSGVRVTDLRSTNGTWVRGARVEVAEALPGEEIAIACTHRLRVDGVP
jgi:hypothetical protein